MKLILQNILRQEPNNPIQLLHLKLNIIVGFMNFDGAIMFQTEIKPLIINLKVQIRRILRKSNRALKHGF
jgi:hypothetical protein